MAREQRDGVTVLFPPGEYFLGAASDDLLLGATKLQNVKFVGPGATISCRSSKGSSSMLYLAGCRNVSVEGLAFLDHGFNRDVNSHGAAAIRLGTEGPVGCENIDIRNCSFESVLSAVVCRSFDGPARSRKITLTDLSVRRSYYGFSFQDNGDEVIGRGLRCDDVKRSYFPFGISNHDIELDTSNNATGFTDVLIKCYHGDTTNIRAKVRCRGKRSGDAIVALDHQHEHGKGTMRNIAIDLDADDIDCRLATVFLIRSFTHKASVERQTGNRWDAITLDGDVRICDRTRLIDIVTEGRTPGTLTLGPRLSRNPRLPQRFPGFTVIKS
jgi:hypothetical protein